MEKRKKAMIAVACVALLVLIGAGCARCSMVHSADQEEQAATATDRQDTESSDQENAEGLESLLGTKWTASDGKTTLSIVNGAFVEQSEGIEKITYWAQDKSAPDEGGFSESIWVSDSLTSTQTPSIVRVDNAESGAQLISSDAFKLAKSYTADAPEDSALSVSGGASYLAGLTGADEGSIVSCLQSHAKKRSPYAKTANWDGEVYIDANSNKTSSTFTLDDPNGTIVTVTIDGATGEVSAM
ncbi:hypothetical protein [Slackia isoflavoniconvertens]|uniref:hypothetical protein n=1 Tax=Slackia isoflavoniconvertens TaxID=572010 RepID=UPI003F997B91